MQVNSAYDIVQYCNHNKTQQGTNRVLIEWDVLYNRWYVNKYTAQYNQTTCTSSLPGKKWPPFRNR